MEKNLEQSRFGGRRLGGFTGGKGDHSFHFILNASGLATRDFGSELGLRWIVLRRNCVSLTAFRVGH